MTVEVTALRVWQCGTYLNSEVWSDFYGPVRRQAGEQGCNKDGFTGLISPLQGTMDWLRDKSDELVTTSIDRLHGTSGGLIATAYTYAGIDQSNRDRFDTPDNKRPRDGEPSGSGITFSTEGSPFRNSTEVKAKSIKPGGKTITEMMDQKYSSASADAINWIVRNFSKNLGLGDKDLRQLVIEPLAGDYNRIRANGVAWTDVGTMLDTS